DSPSLVQPTREAVEADLTTCLDEEGEHLVVRQIRGPVGNAETAHEFRQSDASMRKSLQRGDRSTVGSRLVPPTPVRPKIQPSAVPRRRLVDEGADVDQVAVGAYSGHALLERTDDARANCARRCLSRPSDD